MTRFVKLSKAVLILTFIVFFGVCSSAQAAIFHQIPYEFDNFSEGALDWSDSGDDSNSGSTPLGFSVTIGGAAYDHFDIDSNGYVELINGSGSATGYGYGYIDDLTGSNTSTSTYLLAAYDDLSSWYYGYYGYYLEPDMATFYYYTETYDDEDYEYMNLFEMILSDNGHVQWNFGYPDYSGYDYDLFSGLYFGNTQTLHGLASDTIPQYESWVYDGHHDVVPEPSSMLLLGIGLLGAGVFKRRKIRKGPEGDTPQE